MNVLVVCTGNICRSPMATGLIEQRLAARGIAAGVVSAGLLTEGRAASTHGIEAMARRGIDISAHRSRTLSATLVAGADLVIGMERQHVREAAVLHPDAFPIAFTLPELARLAPGLGPRSSTETVDSWLRRASHGRRPTDLIGEDRSDEVDDPYGRSARRYEATARQLEELIDTVLDHLYPTAPSP